MALRYRSNERLLVLIALVSIIFSFVRPAEAQRNSVTRTLTLGQQIQVRSSRCTLTATVTEPQRYVYRCPGERFNNRSVTVGTRRIIIRARQRAVVRAQGCFLSLFRTGPQRVVLQCVAEVPPTATFTPTATATATVTATPTSTPQPTANANLLLSGNKLSAFSTDAPGTVSAARDITGIVANQVLVGIDRRPQNGSLYGLGYDAITGAVKLYAISSQSGLATALGDSGTFVDAGGNPLRIGVDSTTRFTIDFNPTVDRLRVVTDGGQNFRMNPNSGAFIDGDGDIPGVQRDGNINGLTTSVQHVSYTNNEQGASATTLYTIDATSKALYIQNPANSGNQTSSIPLGQTVDAVLGFDIPAGVNVASSNSPAPGSGFSILRLSGDANDVFTRVDLTTAALSQTAPLGSEATTNVLGLAVHSPLSLPVVALSSSGTEIVRFRSNAPGTIDASAITGIVAGDVLVGIDYRPATGQLMALGVNAAADTATLYLIDPQTGASSVLGTSGSIAFVTSAGAAVDLPLPTAGYGVDFNPTVDRMRVVTSSGLNFRIDPNTGAGVDGDASASGVQPDSALNGSATSADATAYTNSFGGALTTVQYSIDAVSNALYVQTPPNNGTLTTPLVITSAGITLDISAVGGFDIPSDVRVGTSNVPVQTGRGYAALTVDGVTSLYSIDLTTGAATSLGVIGNGMTSMAGIGVGVTVVE